MRWELVLIFVILFSIAVNAIEVDENVEKELAKNGEADVIITFKEKSWLLNINVDADSIVSNLKEEEFDGRYFKNSRIAAGKVSKEGLEKIKKNNNVENVYLDYTFKATLTDSTKLINSSLVNTLRVKGINNLTGKGTGVCVIDTGVDSSLSNFGNRVIAGYNFVSNNNNFTDDNGHGTHVAGIIASSGSLIGVAPEANIIAMKVLDSSGSGSGINLAKGIEWCIDNANNYSINIITMSLACESEIYNNSCDSYTTCSISLLKPLIDEAAGKNISVISSTGNSGSLTHIGAPACLSNATAVGATNKDYTIASYSNRNNLTILMAPGTSITSLKATLNTLSCSPTCSGTSMAAPHVAGMYALISQYLRDENNSLMTNLQIEDVLNRTGMEIIDTTNVRYKFADVYKAILHLDNFNPDVSIENPLNKTYKTNNVSFNFRSLDTNINSSWYNINNGNNVSLSGNTTLNLSNGGYLLNLYSDDTNGNMNSTRVSFAIDTNLPTINLVNPENNTVDIDGSINFNCSATSNVELKNMSLWHNLSGNFKLNQSKVLTGLSSSAEFNLNLDNGQFLWSCLVYNTNESYEFGTNMTATIAINNKPTIDSYAPDLNASVDEAKTLSFNHTSTDIDGDSLTYYWYLDDTEKSSSQNYSYTPGYTESGSHTVSLVVSDSIFNTSLNWSVNVNDVIACGNNIIESGEECEGSDLNGQSCTAKGFSGGTLSCTSSCTFDTNACTSSSSGGGSGGSSGGGSGGGTPISEPDDSQFNDGIPGQEPQQEGQRAEIITTTSTAEEIPATEEVREEPQPPEGITGLAVYKEGITNFALGTIGIIFVLGLLRFIIKRDLLKFDKKG